MGKGCYIIHATADMFTYTAGITMNIQNITRSVLPVPSESKLIKYTTRDIHWKIILELYYR